MRQPAVSVVIPVWNGERYLKEAIESILSQDFTDFELIVVDDGSTDRTREIAGGFLQDRRVKVVIQENGGVVAARNTGLKAARAEFVAFLDADDIAKPDRLSKQLAYMRNHIGIAVIGSYITLFSETKGTLRTEEFPVGPTNITQGLEFRNTMAQGATMVRKSMVMAVGGYRDAFRFGAEDYDLWLRLAEKHWLDNLPEVLTYYRIHPESMTHRQRGEQTMGALAAACAHRRRVAGLPDPLEGLKSPLSSADLALLDLSEQEEAAFMPSLFSLLSKDGSPKAYAALVRRAWELRRHIQRGRLVRHCLAPTIAALRKSGHISEALGWQFRAFMTEPLSACWVLIRRSA
jgi:GT2 family glycosyltransferase